MSNSNHVMTGPVPVISIQLAKPCRHYRDCRVKPGNDDMKIRSRDALASEFLFTR
jgi:hypothetical protein